MKQYERPNLRKRNKAGSYLKLGFGVILPVICVFADPIVFRSNDGKALFSAFQPFAYVLSFVSIIAIMAWLIWGEKLRGLNAILAGLFFTGSFVAFSVGVILFPFSVIGIAFLGIGFLGFVPLLSALVYLRSGVRAFRSARSIFERNVLFGTVILSAVFSLVIPWTVNVEIDAHRPYNEQSFRSLRGL